MHKRTVCSLQIDVQLYIYCTNCTLNRAFCTTTTMATPLNFGSTTMANSFMRFIAYQTKKLLKHQTSTEILFSFTFRLRSQMFMKIPLSNPISMQFQTLISDKKCTAFFNAVNYRVFLKSFD